MTVNGIDYAFFPHPSPAQIKAAGMHFVGRYVSDDPANDANGKNLLPAEKEALLASGLEIILFIETTSNRMLGGNSAGVADAEHFNAVVKALGMPEIPGYFAADFDATPADQTPINAYLDGAASVIGRPRVGLYGDFYVAQRAHSAGKATYFCQTVAWSGGFWANPVHVRQHLQVGVGNISVDLDEAMTADFGQWPRPAVNPPPTGPYRHVLTTRSIAQMAAARHTTVRDLLTVTAQGYTSKDAQTVIDGMIVYTVNP